MAHLRRTREQHAINQKLTEVVTPLLVKLCRERPADPITWLAHALLASKPPPPVAPAGTAQRRHLAATQTALLSDAGKRTLRARFIRADDNGDAVLTRDEFAKHLGLTASSTEADSLFAMLDRDGDGTVSLEEWMAAAGSLPIEGVTLHDKGGDLYPTLNDKTRTFVYNLLGFLASRDGVERTARTVLPASYMGTFASFEYDEHMRQHRLDGSGPVRNYAELSADAAEALPLFTKLMKRIVSRAGLDPDAEAMHNGKPLPLNEEHNFTVLTVAPLKGRARCDEKVANECGGEYACIVDCVRCSIVVSSEAQLITVAEQLASAGEPVSLLAAAGGSASGGAGLSADGLPHFVCVRLKNRYERPLFNGYRDGLYSFAVEVRPGAWVVCEVQVHLAAILSHKKESHHYYEFFRSYFCGSSDAIEKRMAVLDKVGRAPSPDALLREVLGGSDTDALAGLAELFGIDMMGDFPLLVEVEERRLALATASGDGGDEVEVASRRSGLGEALRRCGRRGEAEAMLTQALEVRRKVLGEEHPDTLLTMGSVAVVLMETKRMSEAEAMFKQVIEGRRKALGEEHPETLRTMYNLAVLLMQTRRLDEAEAMYKQTLEAQHKVLGEEHPATLGTMNALAVVLMETKRMGEAEVMFRQVLEVRRKVSGEEHPGTLRTMNVLANLLKQTGRLDEAEALYEQTLQVRRKVLGEEHPDTLKSTNNLALLLEQTGRMSEAEVLRHATARPATAPC